jgi:hypothetical protein
MSPTPFSGRISTSGQERLPIVVVLGAGPTIFGTIQVAQR